VPVRSTVGVPGFNRQQRRNGRPSSRVRIGGAGGADVPEQIVNITQAAPGRHPSRLVGRPAILIFRVESRTGQVPAVPDSGQCERRSGLARACRAAPPNRRSHVGLFVPGHQRQQLARCVRALDQRRGAPVVRCRPSGDRFINLNPPPGGSLISLTAGRTTGFIFAEVQRPSWRGTTEIVFAGRLQNEANFHLFSVDVTSA
jgi:hypothetical protein